MSKRERPEYTADARRKKRKVVSMDPAVYQAKIEKRLTEIQDVTDSKVDGFARLLQSGVFGPCAPEQLYGRLIKVAAGM